MLYAILLDLDKKIIEIRVYSYPEGSMLSWLCE